MPSHPPNRSGQRPGVVIALAALAIVLTATLWPTPEAALAASSTPPTCLLCGERGAVDAILNVALFVPLGFGLARIGWPARNAVAIGFLVSLAIELLQFKAIPGRDASVGDLITNTVGAGLGTWLALFGRSVVLPVPRRARRLAALAAVGWFLAAVTTAWLAQPQETGARPFWGRWAPRYANTEPIAGVIVEAAIGGHDIDNGPILRAEVPGPLFGRDSVAVAVDVLGLLPIGTRAVILAVTDIRHGVLTQVDQDRCRIRFRLRSRSARYRLNIPAVQLENGCGQSPRDTVRIRGRAARDRVSLAVLQSGVWKTEVVPITVGSGWLFLRPVDVAGRLAGLIAACWIGGFLLPLGYWARTGFPIGASSIGTAGIVVLTLGVLPGVVGIAPSSIGDWVAAGISATVGLILAHGRERHRPRSHQTP